MGEKQIEHRVQVRPFNAHLSAFNMPQLKNDGVNMLAFGPIHPVDNGLVSGDSFSRFMTKLQARRAHQSGLAVMMVSEVSANFGEPQPVLGKLLQNPQFWSLPDFPKKSMLS